MTESEKQIRNALALFSTNKAGFYADSETWDVLNNACKPRAITELLARLDAAELDAARLDNLDKTGYSYGFEDVHEGNNWSISGPFISVRDAIDAAMAQGEPL